MENKPVISQEQAAEEIKSWLDYKKVDTKKRLAFVGNIRNMEAAIVDGTLVLDSENFTLTQKLKFPIGTITEFKYKARLLMKDIHTQTQNIKPGDSLAMSFAYISALTGNGQNVVKELDQEDYSMADHISFFFQM